MLSEKMTVVGGLILSSCLLLAGLQEVPVELQKKFDSGYRPLTCAQVTKEAPASPFRNRIKKNATPMKVLFITSAYVSQYEADSFAKNFDFQYDIVSIGSFLFSQQDTSMEVSSLLRYYLATRKYDVIVLFAIHPVEIPADCEKRILELVKEEGVGLVCGLSRIFPRVPSLDAKMSHLLDPAFPLQKDRRKYTNTTNDAFYVPNSLMAETFSTEDLKWVCNVQGTLLPDATAILQTADKKNTLAAFRKYGKGTILAYNPAYKETKPYLLPNAFIGQRVPENEKQIPECSRFCLGVEWANQFYLWLYQAIKAVSRTAPSAKILSFSIIDNGTALLKVTSTIEQKAKVRITGYNRYFDSIKTGICEIQLKQGETEIPLTVPNLNDAGKCYFDVDLLDNFDKTIDLATKSHTAKGGFFAKLIHDPAYHESDASIRGKVLCSSVPQGTKIKMTASLSDAEGNLLAVDTNEFASSVQAIPYRFDLVGKTDGGLLNLKVVLKVNGQEMQLREQLTVRRAEKHWKTFMIGAYSGVDSNPVYDVMVQTLKSTEHNLLKCGYPGVLSTILTAETGMYHWNNWVYSYAKTPEAARRYADFLKKYNPTEYELQDEPELQYSPAVESRYNNKMFPPTFPEFLVKKFQTVEKFNQQYGTNYSALSEVKRPLWYEVVDSPDWSLWFASRQQLDNGFLERYGVIADAIRERDPKVPSSINLRSITTNTGVSVGDVTRRLGGVSLYNNYVRGDSDMGFLTFGMFRPGCMKSYIGYTWFTAPGATMMQREAFDTVRRGTGFVWYIPLGDIFAYLNGDFTLNAKGKPIAEINRRFSSGIGDLAVNSNYHSDGVLVYWPRRKFYVSTLAHYVKRRTEKPNSPIEKITDMPPYGNLKCPMIPLLELSGYQYEIIDESELTAERLASNKAVILPEMLTLGDAELKLLAEFCRKGGTVIADAGCGARDENGVASVNRPEFEKLFGIKRKQTWLAPSSGKENMAVLAAAQTDDIFRNGAAFYINRKMTVTKADLAALQEILKQRKILPRYPLLKNEVTKLVGVESNFTVRHSYTTVVRRFGDTDYIYLASSGPQCEYEIPLNEEYEVYELFKGEKPGRTSVLKGTLKENECRLFSLTKSRDLVWKVSTDKETYKPGDTVRITGTLENLKGEKMVFIKAVSLSGKLPSFPKNLNTDACKFKTEIYIPLNFKGKKCEISFREFLTGSKTVIEIPVN